ncbi:hypothetical protein A9179_16170 [Pseudomonas alcaligenes]|uniref:Alginate lyase 2 domain-containing protein n=1 Tax=Aquipseudomonas alcaligenes TaxID=43263 RepID=A0ABR7S505_AQUAC|nr:polysaccharide lyase family 7 protein [Pseudomonas alcaligenes]MBC9251807.1 hypothetical protein [Pseudomonas alcaligenes]
MHRSILCLASLLLVLAGCRSEQQDERHYMAPAANYDLSHWKLTLPDEQASEVRPDALKAGYASRYFYLADNGAMVFVAPVRGGTTENSDYPRSELRELLDPSRDGQNWFGQGYHRLMAACRVLRSPSSEKIIIGQIHGYDARPLIKLQWDKGRLKALIKRHPEGSEEDLIHLFTTRVNNDLFSYSIEVRDGVLSVEANGERFQHDFFQADPAWRAVPLYFKAGAYVQDAEGGAAEVGEVQFTELQVEHGE